jgi:hypothetical protein
MCLWLSRRPQVLHKMLDESQEGEAVVGISNWALDPAKMNRAVHIYRPAPTVEDLSMTAEGMVKSANLKGYLRVRGREDFHYYFSKKEKIFEIKSCLECWVVFVHLPPPRPTVEDLVKSTNLRGYFRVRVRFSSC